jgi:hypothetical protein
MPCGARKALTRIVESNTALGMPLTNVLNDCRDVLFLLVRTAFTGALVSVDFGHELHERLSRFLTLNHADGFEEKPLFDDPGFQVVALDQGEFLADLGGQGELKKPPKLEQCHQLMPSLGKGRVRKFVDHKNLRDYQSSIEGQGSLSSRAEGVDTQIAENGYFEQQCTSLDMR